MIAYFRYDRFPKSDCISVELISSPGEPLGHINLPSAVAEQMERLNSAAAKSDEPMSLPFALSYGVLAASLTGCTLSICGEKQLWPDHWGMLIDR